jgi:hypothetical protein
MKPRLTLLPIGLILVGIGWLWHRQSEHAALDAEIVRLQMLLARPERAAPEGKPVRPRQGSAIESQPRDWQAVAVELRNGTAIAGGLLSTNAHLLSLIDAMTVEELLAALDEIATADLGEADRDLIERRLATALIKKDPELGFSRFAVREKSAWDFFLGDEFNQWVTRDDAAALAWLRGHTAEDGYVPAPMIHVPFFELLTTAPQTATAILECCPPSGRLEALRSLAVGRIKTSGQKEWAEIIRTSLPIEDQLKAITWPMMNWSDGDGSPMLLGEVDGYLDRIEASDEERKACAMTLATQLRSWTDENGIPGIDRLRDWVIERSPELLEPVTLAALSNMAQYQHFEQASELALGFHDESGNDAYLTNVLDQVNDLSAPATVQTLVARLSDEALRKKYRELLPRKFE